MPRPTSRGLLLLWTAAEASQARVPQVNTEDALSAAADAVTLPFRHHLLSSFAKTGLALAQAYV